IPILSQFALGSMKWKTLWSEQIVMRPRDAFLFQKSFFKNFVDLEFTIPMSPEAGFSDVNAAFWQLLDRMEAWRAGAPGDRAPPLRSPVNQSVPLRFTASSQALLSPAYAPQGSPQHTCYLEYISYSSGWLAAEYDAFNRDFYSPDHERGWMKW